MNNEFKKDCDEFLTKQFMTTPNTTPSPTQRVEREIDFQVSLYDKKYTYIRYKNGWQEALRYGEKWRDLTGDGFIYSLAARVEELATELEEVQTDYERMCDVACGQNTVIQDLCQQLADKTQECGDIHAELIQAKETFVIAFPKLLKQDVEIRQLRTAIDAARKEQG